jgi:hypothetical protein
MRRNTLLGFATIEHASGLVLTDIAVHEKEGRAWAAAPSKPMISADGSVMREADTGKVRYVSIVTFTDDVIRRRWSDAVVAAVRRDYREAFEAVTSPVAPPPVRPLGAAVSRRHDETLMDDPVPF